MSAQSIKYERCKNPMNINYYPKRERYGEKFCSKAFWGFGFMLKLPSKHRNKENKFKFVSFATTKAPWYACQHVPLLYRCLVILHLKHFAFTNSACFQATKLSIYTKMKKLVIQITSPPADTWCLFCEWIFEYWKINVYHMKTIH